MGTTNEEAKNSIEGFNGVQGRTHQRRLRLRSRAVRSLCRHSTNKSFCREVLCNRSFCCIGPGERSGRNQRDKKNNQKVRRQHKIGQQPQHNKRHNRTHNNYGTHKPSFQHHESTFNLRQFILGQLPRQPKFIFDLRSGNVQMFKGHKGQR
jgi:hypothetical protein